MFNHSQELLFKIRLGEDSFLELKEVRFAGDRVSAPHRDSLADELAAFANARGGVCVLGVDDGTRDVIGIPLELLDRVEDFVGEVSNDSIEPPLLATVERLWLPTSLGTEAAVLKIEVPRSLFVHRSPGGCFHRIGSSKRQVSPQYLARLFQQRSQTGIIRFDEQPIGQAKLADLSEAHWRRFQTARSAGESAEDFSPQAGDGAAGR
jgi:predicted HTH transcriptional regulator